jgi:cation transport protein ChaC
MPVRQSMTLTANLVASVAQVIEDAGPVPGAIQMTDEDYAAAIRDTLAGRPARDFWLFACGSLLWNPVCEDAESRRAVVQGWHRAFCFRVNRGRGTVGRPGLMMALDRGGQCHSMVFRLPAGQLEESLDQLFRREIIVKPWINLPRWLTVRTSEGPVQALGFVVNRQNARYVGRLTLEEIANILSVAAGHRGSCAEYLHNTVAHLEEIGIRDRNLWRLQALVAKRIKAATP